MTSPFDLQQTADTIRARSELVDAIARYTTEEVREANRREYAAYKARHYKISLINAWRKKERK